MSTCSSSAPVSCHILEHEDMGMMGNYEVVAYDRNEHYIRCTVAMPR